MVFSSSIFVLYFFPIFLVIYYSLGHRIKGLKNWWLLFASLFFYAWGEPQFVFVILSVLITDFFLVKQMNQAQTKRQKKILLTLSLLLKLSLLIYFKYVDFFIENINTILELLGTSSLPLLSVVLPLGISFFTFQSISYSIDVYRGTCAPLKNLRDYLLYILLFPQLIAGPIVRFNDIADQIEDRTHSETDENRLLGWYRFVIGLSKKVLIANTLGAEADQIFDGDTVNLGFRTAWYGVICYTMQIYYDFSGYSDMAIGIARMVGFKMPENFDNPYVSRSITEFWRRWHITLGNFMKDYLYIPLGGNRNKNPYRTYFNLWVVFFISGLWHGAGWTFILWGCYHGLFLVMDRLFLKNLLKHWGAMISIPLTFLLAMLGWVLFRAENTTIALHYYEALGGLNGNQQPLFVPSSTWCVLVIALLFSFCTISNFGKKAHHFVFQKQHYDSRTHVLFSLATVLFIFIDICLIVTSDFNPFIYFRF